MLNLLKIYQTLNKKVVFKNVPVGLDLGAYSLKMALVVPKNGEITHLNESKLDVEAKDNLKPALLELKKSLELYSPVAIDLPVIASIPAEDIFYRYFDFVPISSNELKTAVTAQALKHTPVPLEKIYISCLQVPQITAGKKRLAVFAAALDIEFVNSTYQMLKDCGLEVKSLIPPAMALVKEFSKNHKEEKNQFFALINIGYSATTIVITHNGYPYYARKFSLGGKDFIYAFQMAHRNTRLEAEGQMISYNVCENNVAVDPFLSKWLSEINKSFSAFHQQFSKEEIKIARIYLSGGCAQIKGLESRMTGLLKIEVKQDHWEHILPSGQELKALNPGTFKLAAGLALSQSSKQKWIK
jgi:type IV pilus assembly protein PilM